jgi:hypothetical protein
MKAYARKAGCGVKKAGNICFFDGFTWIRAPYIICLRWRFTAPLVETSPEILTSLVDFGSDLAVLFPFAREGPVFEN